MADSPKIDEPVGSGKVQLRPAVVALFYVLALGSYLSRVIIEPSYFFQLALGHWMTATGSVPWTNRWTAIGQDLPWCAPGWLYSVLLSLTETRFGELGIAVFLLVVGWVFVGGVLFAFSSVAKSYFFGGLVTTLVAAGALEGTSVSPLHIGLAGVAAILALLSAELRGLRYLLLFIVSAATTNLSSLGPAAVLSGLLVGFHQPSFATRAGVALALTAGLLCSPYGGADVLQQVITEWPSRLLFELETRANVPSIFDYSVAFLLLLSLIVALLLASRGPALRGGELLLALGSVLLGLVVRAALPYALVAVGYCAVRVWRDAPPSAIGELGVSLLRLRTSLARLPSVGTTWILFCLVVINVKKFAQEPVVPVLLPTSAIDYLLDEQLAGPVFHELAVGGYVAYRFSLLPGEPERLAYLDDRAVFFDPRSAKQEFALSKLSEGWRGLFDRFPPQTVLVRTKTALWELLRRDKGWKLVYQDKQPDREAETPLGGESMMDLPFGWAIFARASDVESAGEL